MVKVIAGNDRQHEILKYIAKALNLKAITYEDRDRYENYHLETEDGVKITLRANGNQFDGGFLTIDLPDGIQKKIDDELRAQGYKFPEVIQ